MQVKTLIDKATAVGVGPVVQLGVPATFHAWIEGTSGTVTATLKLWASNDSARVASSQLSYATASGILLATISFSATAAGAGKSVAADAIVNNAPYGFYWGEVSAISGTGAKVSLVGNSSS